MDTKRKTRVVPALLVVLALVALLVHRRGGKPAMDRAEFVTEFPIFGTVAKVTLHAPRAHAMQATKGAMDRLRALHDTINVFDPESELAVVNRTAAAQPVRCSEELWALLLAAKWAYEETDGAFDVTIGPLMTLWGLHRKRETLPSDEELREARLQVGFD
ncbi:MAG: FAD:protein FMN transferase, partial [Lentisphaeria bacterium]|nr:FAD:protein FMN transferase [Lentisphaeria bacterium]